MRRRARFLRKARELAYRDLGGLVFNLHRFGQRNDVLVIAKLTTLSHIDTELRALEAALEERHPVTILREAGISACPRCAAIHSGDDRFCPNCGLSMSRRVDLPVAGAPAPVAPAPGTPPQAAPPATGPSAGPVQTRPPSSMPLGSGAGAPAPAPGPMPLSNAGPAPVKAPPPAADGDQPTEVRRPPAHGA
jgi:hypothetical protein